MTTPVRIAITGAAGQIGYSLVFRIASGAITHQTRGDASIRQGAYTGTAEAAA